MIIKGDFNEAEVFTENIDKETISQIKQLLDQEFGLCQTVTKEQDVL